MHRFFISGIVHNEEKTIPWFLEHAAVLKDHGLAGIVWVENGSTDNTTQIIEAYQKKYVVPIHLYHEPFVDFGTTRTSALRKVPVDIPWVFILDPDERVVPKECAPIQKMLADPTELWYVPRRKWADLCMSKQLEKNLYPDWQCRFVRNRPHIRYQGRVHEMLIARSSKMHTDRVFHVHHLEPHFRTAQDLNAKYGMYAVLQRGGSSSEAVVRSNTRVESFDPDRNETTFLWEDQLKSYTVAGLTTNGYPNYKWEHDFVIRRTPPPRRIILDAGGGVGVLQVLLSKMGHQVLNVDRHPRIGHNVNAINAKFGIGIQPYNTPLNSIPLPDCSVDAVVSVSSLEHNMPNVFLQCMTELTRVLRPGGNMLLTIPVATEDVETWDPRVHALWRWSPQTLHRAISSIQGLEPIPGLHTAPAQAEKAARTYCASRMIYPVGIWLQKKK